MRINRDDERSKPRVGKRKLRAGVDRDAFGVRGGLNHKFAEYYERLLAEAEAERLAELERGRGRRERARE